MSQILEIDGSVLEGVSNIIQLVNIIEISSVENELDNVSCRVVKFYGYLSR